MPRMLSLRKTKIIATVGPSTFGVSMLRKAILSGVDVFRLNFSHGDHSSHAQSIADIREAATMAKRSVGILADLQGPEVRTGGQSHSLRNGELVALSHKKRTAFKFPLIQINYAHLPKKVFKGQRILVDDGYLALRVQKVVSDLVICKVLNSWKLGERKSINIPNIDLELPIIAKKDKEDLRFIVGQDIDWLAVSFVSSGKDVADIKAFLKRSHRNLPVIAKIENSLALQHLEGIIDVSEGIMVARGDLGAELPTERVPIEQRNIIEKAKERGKIVIVATQMLDSMVKNPRPTRAEATDISNACLQQVDALLLSGETASGQHPLAAISVMHQILVETEKAILSNDLQDVRHHEEMALVCKMSLLLAMEAGAKLLVTISQSGKSPRIIASYKSRVFTIVACTQRELYHRSHMYYSVMPMMVAPNTSPQVQLNDIERELKKLRLVKKNDIIILMYTFPTNKDSTNTIRQWAIK